MFRKWFRLCKITILIICLSLNILTPKSADADINSPIEYISLGDSIAYGLTAPSGQGYSDLFYSYLQSKPELDGLNFYNLSHPGDQSSDLLVKLQNDSDIRTHLGQAGIVTLSVGGNNLLIPVIRSVASLYHLDLSDPQLYSKLGKAIQSNDNIESSLLGFALSGTIESQLDTGVASFKEDWPKIMKTLRALAPRSQIYVLNVYNPFAKDDPLFSLLNPYVTQINSIIEENNGYSYADIYTRFLIETVQKPLTFNLLRGDTDPHPTKIGHRLIFQTLSALYEMSSAVPWEGKTSIPTDKKWTIKFNTLLAKYASNFIRVYTSSGVPINVTIRVNTISSDTLIVEPPTEGYPAGSYCLLISAGLPAISGQTLIKSVSMNFTVE
jgi:lysophospholipase L1-like esterase